MVPPSMPSRGQELVEGENLSVGQREPPPGDWTSSRTSRPMGRMFRDLFGYIKVTRVNVALAQTE
jgi:hypothetical protein